MEIVLEGSIPAAMEDKLAGELAKIKKLVRANPLEVYNNPLLLGPGLIHKKQLSYHASGARYKAFIGGNRTGKTTGGIADDLIQALPEEWVPEHLLPYKKWKPPFKCWIGVPSYQKLMDTHIPKLRELTPPGALMGGSFDEAFKKQDNILWFACGSFIAFKTYEQRVDAWASADLHRIHLDEEPEGEHGEAIWSEANARLIDHRGDLVITMTPLFGYTLIHDKIWERRHEPGISVTQAGMRDNPWLDPVAVDEFLATLTDEERRVREHGEFVHFGGLFFPEFSDEEHVVELSEKEIRSRLKEQDVIVSIDPGLNRTGVVWVAFDGDNAGLVFAEAYMADAIVPDVAKAVKDINAYWELEPSYYVIDPSAKNRRHEDRERIEGAYVKEGLDVGRAQNDRATGILEVKRRLQKHGLTVSRECRNLIWEMGRYRKDPKAQDEFAAIKRDDHVVDALRYALMERPWYSHDFKEKKPYAWTPGDSPSFEQLYEIGPTSVPPLGSMM